MKRPLWKRPFDLVIGTALFIVLIPVMGLVAVLILIVDGPPVLFRQTRVGMGARLFTMVKFRTMRVGAEGDEPLNPDGSIANRRDDPRVSRLGGWLRRTSLDELPQLWNVVRGEMSLVGPRPELPREVTQYSPRHQSRLEVRPGMTGLAAVSGRNKLPWERRLDYDVEYVETMSFFGDMKILWRTLVVMTTAHGVFQPDEDQE